MISTVQIRMARAALEWSMEDLAGKSGVARTTLNKLIHEHSNPKRSTIEKIVSAFEENGITFIGDNGVRFSPLPVEIIDGSDCYMLTLDRVVAELSRHENKELLIMFASDAVSPPAVNERYRQMRKNGVTMRQLIAENDTYIMGPLEEYRTIPMDEFINIVSLVFGNCVAQVNGDESAVTIYNDAKLALQRRKEFEYRWNVGHKPEISTAEVKF